MKREEYLKTAPMTYREYCGYLQQKYGVGRSAYMTASWNKSKKCTRTNEGLFTHHIFEDHAIMLPARIGPYGIHMSGSWRKILCTAIIWSICCCIF